MMIRQTLFAGLFVMTGLLTAPVAYADAAGEKLVRNALNNISAQSGWNAQSNAIRSEGDQVIVDGLSISHSGSRFNISADTLALSGLSERGSGYFASNVAVQGLSVDYDLSAMLPDRNDNGKENASMATQTRFDRLDAVDLFLPASVGSGQSDGQSGFLSGFVSFYSYLAKVELASLSAPVVRFEQSVEAPGVDRPQTTRTTYHDARITGWTGGVIDRYELGRLEIAVTGGPEGDIDLSAEGASVDYFDLAHTAHVLDPAEYAGGRGDGVWKPLMKSAEYRGFRINSKDVTVDIGRIGLTGFEARQTDTPVISQFDKLIAAGVTGRKPSDEETLEMLTELLPNIFGFFRLGDFTMEGLKVTPVVSSKQGSASLDLLQVTGFSSDGIDRFAMEGLSATGPDQSRFSIGSFGFEGLGFPDSKILMEMAEAAQRGEDLENNPQLMGKLFDLYPTIEAVMMRDLTGSAMGKEPFGIDEVSFQVTARMNALIASGKGAIRGLVFPASYFDQGGPNPLRMMNYDRLALDMISESVWDEDTTDLDYRLDLLVEDVGDLVLEYGLTGVTDASVRKLFNDMIALQASSDGDPNPEQVIAILDGFGFTGFSFSFTDRSMVGRGLTVASSMQGADVQTYRDQLKGALPFFMSSMPPGEFRQQAADALVAALDGGYKTTFSMAPRRTITAADMLAAGMQDPFSLIVLLGAGMSSEPAN